MSIDNNLIYKLDNIEGVEIDTLRKSLKAIGLIGKKLNIIETIVNDNNIVAYKIYEIIPMIA